MGIQYSNYFLYISNLINELKVKKLVKMKGFLQREKIYLKYKNKNTVFISLSLHSDENFGMAALRSLHEGHRAILSAWGGHADLKKYFPKRVKIIEVDYSDKGPFIHSKHVIKCIYEMLNEKWSDNKSPFPLYYSDKSISPNLLKIALSPIAPEKQLDQTTLAEKILKNRKRYLNAPNWKLRNLKQSRIFKSYGDPISEIFFKTYGAFSKQNPEMDLNKKNILIVYPWIKFKSDHVFIDDPHRGKFKIKRLSRNSSRLISNRKEWISINTARTLISWGYAHIESNY